METATLGGGCFWCTEAIFKRLKGVTSVISGYAGGNPSADGENPSYENVSSGTTRHLEAIQIEFDPSIISYEKILEVFFATHDPTTPNRQGYDVGPQYRSAIFYHSKKQQKIAERLKKPSFVTEILPFSNFYKAEEYHQSFYDKNKSYPYCQIIINPKIQKLSEEFKNDVKKDS
ncbi:MAG: peptide-methionine (S)-S-oxide reductase MsrA [Patescibacteria group bacterium]